MYNKSLNMGERIRVLTDWNVKKKKYLLLFLLITRLKYLLRNKKKLLTTLLTKSLANNAWNTSYTLYNFPKHVPLTYFFQVNSFLLWNLLLLLDIINLQCIHGSFNTVFFVWPKHTKGMYYCHEEELNSTQLNSTKTLNCSPTFFWGQSSVDSFCSIYLCIYVCSVLKIKHTLTSTQVICIHWWYFFFHFFFVCS